jgi:hypothetical protein
MPIEWRVDEARGLVRAALTGDCTLDEMLALLESVADSAAPRPLRVLSDHRTLSLPITPSDAQAFVGRMTERATDFAGTQWGVVVGSAASYGMIRMIGTLLEPIGMQVEPFYTPDAAESWVAGGSPELPPAA